MAVLTDWDLAEYNQPEYALDGGVMVSTRQTSHRGESAMLKPLGLGFTRSEKQTKILANDEYFALAA